MQSPPHFVIVGAPKCGTTSLYNYLQQHPLIFMPANKEPRFFCNYDVTTFKFGTRQFHPDIVTSDTEYRQLYADAPANTLCGEASTDYLSCVGSAKRIHAWNPACKIIIMLRDPIARAFSEYKHSLAGGFQNENFATSLKLESQRRAEGYDPIFAHVCRGLYFNGVKSYLDIFGRDNVMVILAEDFDKSTSVTVESVFKFLDIAPIDINTSSRYNTDIIHKKPKGIRRIATKLLGRSIVEKTFPAKSISRPELNKELSAEQYKCLKTAFTNDVESLASLLSLDLKHWLRDYDSI